MTYPIKTILTGAALAVAVSSTAYAQQTQAPAAVPTASEQAQPRIMPRKPAAAAGQTVQTRQFGERHARSGHHDDRGWFFFGRHGERDRGHDRDCDDRSSARSGQQPAAPGSVAPPANGLFNNGATPKVQTN
ncbi:hypothetical protein [Rhodovulum adriaticum]|uniref:Uncharacterized protein n=1 Tax=Rhodovulum adriaticum TaxID=35804 RepID=A0A4R2NL26_RHOAD|nr:hypothetical protein [Rhodovulum adriaticum]MBK1637206.1 hypothetical protein [Rhodovulum adriaticum]TCP21965.1 hypothetical protein EV656_10811 [Rhodovulum adriaticum]